MTLFAISADGTAIAYDRSGTGEPLIIVGGIFADRSTTAELAGALSGQFSVINFDRRGRGESGNTAPYAVEREVEDIAALVEAAGGRATLFGHSAGAALSLHAAAAGLPVTRLALYEPPYGPDDELSKNQSRELAVTVKAALAEERRSDAIRLFFANFGLPEEMLDGMAADPRMLGVALTMRHDFEIMGELSRGGIIPEDVVRAVRVPTVVMAGGDSPEFFHDTASRLVALLPAGRLQVVDGCDHSAAAELVAPAVAGFLNAERAAA
jgi:pimeloyl-ACP methyl ester carboxylesterase